MFSPQEQEHKTFAIGVIIPCFRVKAHVLQVIASLPAFVDRIYVVDDACPEGSGQHVAQNCTDPRVHIFYHKKNLGVGGAMVTGYREAIADNCDIAVKMDGDGQMDATLLPSFILPIAREQADYTKGNRFYMLESLRGMPIGRIIGNAALSFATKLSSGYWRIFDPTNGYTCISVRVLKLLPLDKIYRGYFFESDLLFRLNTVGAMVIDIPMKAVYSGQHSNLSVLPNALAFSCGHARNFFKRILYNYFLRNFSVASLELVFGLILFLFGMLYGFHRWAESFIPGHAATAGTVMLAALPVIMGFQLLMSFINHDVASQPSRPISPHLSDA